MFRFGIPPFFYLGSDTPTDANDNEFEIITSKTPTIPIVAGIE
ncbi:MAG: hypothetical protein WA421_15650 [Nitrososphaeraceae archaeon]